MTEISFTIPGRIGGKGRPRFSTRGGQIRSYTPAKTRSTEATVRYFAEKAMASRIPLEGPVALSIAITLNPPSSWSKKRKSSAYWVTGKPDADNILKLFGDALNGICFKDDSQVAQVYFLRNYKQNEGESVSVSVFSLLPDPSTLMESFLSQRSTKGGQCAKSGERINPNGTPAPVSHPEREPGGLSMAENI